MSNEHSISQIAAQTAYMKSQHQLKVATVKTLEDQISSVDRKILKINEKFNEVQDKKIKIKDKHKIAQSDRKRQLLSNEYLSQSVLDLEDQAKALESKVIELENYCNGNIEKNNFKLLQLRKSLTNVPMMMTLTKLQTTEEELSKGNNLFEEEVKQLQREIIQLRISQKQGTKDKIIALVSHAKFNLNLENLPSKIEEYNEQLEGFRKQDEKKKKDSMTSVHFNFAPRPSSTSVVDLKDLENLFSFTTPRPVTASVRARKTESMAAKTIKSNTSSNYHEGKQKGSVLAQHSPRARSPMLNPRKENNPTTRKTTVENPEKSKNSIEKPCNDMRRIKIAQKTNANNSLAQPIPQQCKDLQKQSLSKHNLHDINGVGNQSCKVLTNQSSASQSFYTEQTRVQDKGAKVPSQKVPGQRTGRPSVQEPTADGKKNVRNNADSPRKDGTPVPTKLESARRNLYSAGGAVHSQTPVQQQRNSQDLRAHRSGAEGETMRHVMEDQTGPAYGPDQVNDPYTEDKNMRRSSQDQRERHHPVGNSERIARKSNSQRAGIPSLSPSPSKRVKLLPGTKNHEDVNVHDIPAAEQRYEEQVEDFVSQQDENDFFEEGDNDFNQQSDNCNQEDAHNINDENESAYLQQDEAGFDQEQSDNYVSEESEKSKYFGSEDNLDEERPGSVFSLYDEDAGPASVSSQYDIYGNTSMDSASFVSQDEGGEGEGETAGSGFFNFDNATTSTANMFSFF